MKKFLFLIGLILSCQQVSVCSWDYWLRQSTPTITFLRKCTFTDSLNGWSAGDSGVIIHTTDGGLSWVRQNSTINYTIYSLHFSDPRNGWGIANDFVRPFSTILHTSNGGLNWTSSLYPDSTQYLLTIYFRDSLNGYMGGTGGLILKTTNGGANWITGGLDTSTYAHYPVANFDAYSPFFVLASGGINDRGGIIWRSTDSGLLWFTHPVSFEPILDLHFFDSLHILGSGGDFKFGAAIVRSSNAGINWEYSTLNIFGVATSIAARNNREIWLPLSIYPYLAVSFDSAVTWFEYPAPDSSTVWDALFADQNHGWGCGTNGLIIKYNPPPIGIQNQSAPVPFAAVLYQNYPNPFNPSTTIKWYLLKPSAVWIKIYDVTGREMKTLFQGFQKGGEHSIEFNAEDFPSGVYFYRLVVDSFGEAEKFIESKKMLILR